MPAFIFFGCAENSKTASAVGFYFDTVVTITGYCGEDVLNDALSECAVYEALLSRTIEGSDVWNINNANGAPVTVSDATAEVLSLALAVSRDSGGVFDITTAPVSDLWDFTAENPSLPDSGDISDALTKVDWTKIALDGNTATLPAGMSIDLGGIAKGYIADKIAEYLVSRDVECAVLNFGGNVVMLGEKPDGSDWAVGIQDPAGKTGEYLTVLKTSARSAVTSGTYERGFDLDGVRYHHILDTETGMPVQNGLASVTVLGESSAAADALSTACFALGVEKGSELLEKYGMEGVFVDYSGKVHLTDGLK